MDCRDENRLSHIRSFRARNGLPQWKNKDRPATHSVDCSILEASLGRRGECGWPAPDQFGGAGDVLGDQLTRGIINTEWAAAKAAFAMEFHQKKTNTWIAATLRSDTIFR
jgi:hypothetical protein